MKDKVLCVDDDADEVELLIAALERLGFAAEGTTSPSVALERAASEAFDVILTDLGMAEMDGLALCERLLGGQPGIPVIVVTAHGSMEAAIRAMRVGAYDFLTKPVDSKLLGIAVARAAQHSRLHAEVRRLRDALGAERPHGLLGQSAAIKRVEELIRRVGPTDVSVLLHGETGTGKELVARALHQAGSRAGKPFVPVNCAAIPATLLESELFGHAKGAFTDARLSRAGLFVEASGGTLFLDEISEMPQEMQAKLLRALQERTVRPLGANAEVPFDTRVIAATHRNLEEEVAAGRFRQDLFFRINVVAIEIPPLRERGGDILTLAAHFLAKAGAAARKPPPTLSSVVAERLLAYDWPGNVRELENCLQSATALARFEALTVADLPEKIRAFQADRFKVTADDPGEILSLEELERRYIIRVIKLLNGNKARAAGLLGLDRRTLYRRLEKYGAGAAPAPGVNDARA